MGPLNRTGFICLICDGNFSKQGNLDRHLKWVHNIEKKSREYAGDAKMFKCLECGVSFKYNSELRHHLESKHGIEIVVEMLTFENYNEFNTWLISEEKRSKVQFVKHTGIKRKNNIETLYLNCIRSGKEHTVVVNRKRNKSTQGSCRINRSCTSQIIVRTDLETNICEVEYFKTHYGHDHEVKYLRVSRFNRQSRSTLISSKLAQNNIRNIKKCTFYVNKKEKLKKHIEAMALQIIDNVKSKNYTIEQLSSILQNLKACAAVVTSLNSIATNSDSSTASTEKAQPNEILEKKSVTPMKQKYILIKRENLKPYTMETSVIT